jgi:plastocyanin
MPDQEYNNQPTDGGAVHPPASSPPPKSNRSRLVPLVAGLVLLVLVGALVVVTLNDKDKKAGKQKPASQSQTTAAVQPAGAVTITAQGFNPATIKVKSGQSVIWTNADDKPHQVSTDPYPSADGLAGFNSEEPLAKSETYSFTFDKPGTYTYHDKLNPLKLKGTVIVE